MMCLTPLPKADSRPTEDGQPYLKRKRTRGHEGKRTRGQEAYLLPLSLPLTLTLLPLPPASR